jgi:exopolysaccharide biosynthesis protein
MENSTIDKDELEEVKIIRKSKNSERNTQKSNSEHNNIKKSNSDHKHKKNSKKKKKKKGSKVAAVFSVLFSLGTIGIIVVLFLLYGPYNGFRDWLVTTAMTTMTHQYFATWFYDDKTIEYILDNNKVVELDEDTDTSLIDTNATASQVTEYENEYERAILERDPDNNDYKIIEISGKGYDGYLVAVYDPSRVKTVCTENLGTSGQYLTTMAKNNDALIAINGGGFNDPNYNSTGGEPLGITVCSGKYVTSASYSGSGGIIGFTEDDKLVLTKASVSEAKKLGIRDAVTFGPFLIVNGKAAEVVGNGGWGEAPRTVIGQRKDGIVLFLVIDGRKGTKQGASIKDLIEIMKNYGAYNAANLDGGTSSVLVVNNVIVNDPIDSTGAHKTRPISTGFIVTKDESDDSDHSVVSEKVD